MTGKDVLPEKDLLEKVAVLTRFECLPLGKELKKQTSVAEKQYQIFDKVFNHDEKEKPVKIKKEGSLTTNESSLFYDSKYSFSEYRNVRKYVNDALKSKYNILVKFYNRLDEFKKFFSSNGTYKREKVD